MKIYFQTFGCKVNQYETAALEELFEKKGYVVSDTPNGADVCVINSCTVTGESDNKAGQALRHLRRSCPDSVIVMSGCYPQANPQAEKDLPEADIVTGTKNRQELPRLVEEFLKEKKRIVFIPEYGKDDKYEDMTCSALKGHTRAFLKIEDGCDRFCSYCMIPFSRGRIRSKPMDSLISEVKGLVRAGYCEFVLTGINLAFYGKEYGLTLADAAETIGEIDGVKRIRLGSLEPEMLTDTEISRLSGVPKLCPSFHISLQSGSDKILKAMNRRYTAEEYYLLVRKIRDKFKDASITTDIMTGFPGETEEDFSESCEFAKKIGFSDMHVFPYSVRAGTRAEKMPFHVGNGVKYQRAEKMTALSKEMRRKFLEENIGKTFPVLFEREKNDGFHRGFTPNYILIKTLTKNSNKSLRNSIFYVTIDKIEDGCCIGHIESGEVRE